MTDNPLEHLPDVPDALEESITLGKDPKNIVAKKTTSAYLQASLAAAVAIPLMAPGGVPTISNIPVRKPDENLPAQSQGNAEPMRSLMVATTSADSLSIGGVESESREGESVYVVKGVYLQGYHSSESVESPKSQSTVESSLDEGIRPGCL